MPRLREPPVFFIDHCLGTEKVAGRLRDAGAAVRVLVDEGFGEDAEDVEWLPVVAAKPWAVLTKDRRMRRHPLERQAILAAKAGAFILTSAGLGGDAIASAFERALPRMTAIWHTRTRPFIATVSADGRVTIVEGGARSGGVRRDKGSR